MSVCVRVCMCVFFVCLFILIVSKMERLEVNKSSKTEACIYVLHLISLSGCCNRGGQGARDNRPSEESDVSGETAAGEPK